MYIIFNNSHGKPFLFPIKSFYVFGPCVLLIFLFKKAGVIFLERKVIFIFYSINDQEWIGACSVPHMALERQQGTLDVLLLSKSRLSGGRGRN